MMNFVERQVLMLNGVIVHTLQLIEQIGNGGRGSDVRTHRHRVDQQANHRIGTGQVGRTPRHRRTERDVVLTGQPRQHLSPRGL
ncbi:Uncharacterised protein [Mycobacteroides abscessus]|nr:Uncharacterised protein [Mycobacteroides abscessus]CPU63308.1 Uncharacterised protein [Mycobacteroides abscessus]SKU64152.1 Uncharacterised protein [Mycobacteroides abscessus subsp. abscessus]